MRQRLILASTLGLAFLAGVAVPWGSRAEDDSKSSNKEQQKKIRALLSASGANDTGKQVIDQLLAQATQLEQMGKFPRGVHDRLEKIATPEAVIDLIVPIYQKHVEKEDIDALIAFYESPPGKRFAKAQPLINKEMGAACQAWAADLAQKVKNDMAGTKPK